MVSEVVCVPNPVVGKPPLPDFRLATDQRSQRVRISTLDQLDGALDGYVVSGSKQKMDMIGHENESVDRVAAFSTVMIKGLEE
jgi:hypothetical protein